MCWLLTYLYQILIWQLAGQSAKPPNFPVVWYFLMSWGFLSSRNVLGGGGGGKMELSRFQRG